MDKQAQVDKLASLMWASWGGSDSDCSWNDLDLRIKYKWLVQADYIISNGYTRSTPLVALDIMELQKLYEEEEKLWLNSKPVSWKSWIITSIVNKLGTPVARIPSEEMILKTLSNIYPFEDKPTLNRYATAIRKLCEELNK